MGRLGPAGHPGGSQSRAYPPTSAVESWGLSSKSSAEWCRRTRCHTAVPPATLSSYGHQDAAPRNRSKKNPKAGAVSDPPDPEPQTPTASPVARMPLPSAPFARSKNDEKDQCGQSVTRRHRSGGAWISRTIFRRRYQRALRVGSCSRVGVWAVCRHSPHTPVPDAYRSAMDPTLAECCLIRSGPVPKDRQVREKRKARPIECRALY